MKRMQRASAAATLLAIGTFASAEAAADGAFYGLLRARDLTPFGLLRLDMRPAHAVSIEEGTWAFETELDYQNTWALSPEVESYLVSLEPQGRRDLGPADLQAIQDLPGENYLVDAELAALDVTMHYKISPDWTAYLIASAMSYHGGFLDGAIEDFHDFAGFSTFGRPAASRNDANLIFDLKSGQTAFFGTPTGGGILDPTIGVRYLGISRSETWQLTAEAAVKIPISGRRLLLSTGKTDYGVQLSLQRLGSHQAFYANAAAVYYQGANEPVSQASRIIPTLILGYELKLTDNTNVNLQGYVSSSVYSRDQTDLEELLSEKYQLSLGVRHRFDRFLLSFAVTENLQNINNTPDIGFQLGLAFIPQRVGAED